MEGPPEVLKPGKLGLGGPRPERIDGMLTSPCSLGPMHGFTWGKTADARVVNFNGQTSWRITPRFFISIFVLFTNLFQVSRFRLSWIFYLRRCVSPRRSEVRFKIVLTFIFS